MEEQDLAEILKRSPHFWKRYHAFWKRSPAFWKRSAFWKRAPFWTAHELEMASIYRLGLLVLLVAATIAEEAARERATATRTQQPDLLVQEPEEGDAVFSSLVEDRNATDGDDDAMEEDLAEFLERPPHFWKQYRAFWKHSLAFGKLHAFWKRALFE
ncbi:unnamed protein product [Dibothriocephalus latus]|uniref:Uncharacterized protein n=1 Tax=Dibothriocephalus latus TaxID=60516 RepID=A0A3P6UU81_DIBLA|nr:unnamed protein product [Dibothriocephalus latus]